MIRCLFDKEMGEEGRKRLRGSAGGSPPGREELVLCHEYRRLTTPGSVCQH